MFEFWTTSLRSISKVGVDQLVIDRWLSVFGSQCQWARRVCFQLKPWSKARNCPFWPLLAVLGTISWERVKRVLKDENVARCVVLIAIKSHCCKKQAVKSISDLKKVAFQKVLFQKMETGNWQKWKLCCRKRDRLQPWTLEVCVCQHLHLHAINQQNMYSANTQTVKFGSKLILTFHWQEMQIHYRNRFDEQWSAQFQKKRQCKPLDLALLASCGDDP